MNRRFALKPGATAGHLAFVAGCSTDHIVGGEIVNGASENNGFSTLVAVVSAASLVETLQGDGPFAVFARINEAFAALAVLSKETSMSRATKIGFT